MGLQQNDFLKFLAKKSHCVFYQISGDSPFVFWFRKGTDVSVTVAVISLEIRDLSNVCLKQSDKRQVEPIPCLELVVLEPTVVIFNPSLIIL